MVEAKKSAPEEEKPPGKGTGAAAAAGAEKTQNAVAEDTAAKVDLLIDRVAGLDDRISALEKPEA